MTDMDERFVLAAGAIRSGDLARFAELIRVDPTLASGRSGASHPTLMQCLVLDGAALPASVQIGMAAALADAGSILDEPLIAAGSTGASELVLYLLDRGACLDGRPDLQRGWTVLEEALYWGQPELIAVLLARGATPYNLRIAAGVGRTDVVGGFFDADARLDVERAGPINWPFGELPPEQRSSEPHDLIDHAFVYAAMGGQLETAGVLLDRGAVIDVQPLGFHYRAAALHRAAIRGLTAACWFLLERGADAALLDLTGKRTPAEWARDGGHEELAGELERRAAG